MSKGISNFQVENAIENIEDKDLNDNFVGVFSSNHLNKFINQAAMISGKKGKYPFVIYSLILILVKTYLLNSLMP